MLQTAGLRGWDDVYLIRSYHVDMGALYDHFVKRFREHIPGHRLIWTALAVPGLAFPAMKVEIEVEAIKQ